MEALYHASIARSVTKADRQVEIGGVRRRRGHLQRTDTIEPACILCACRELHDVMNSRLHPCKQRDGSARLIAKCKRRHLRTHSKMKELKTLAAGLPTIFQDRQDVAAGGFASYGSANATPRGNEAAFHGWTRRRAGRGAHLLTLHVAKSRETSLVIACAVGHLWPQVLELPRARKACQRCLAASFRLTS